jgi:IclR family KDG regulon transcriptional repressor
MITKQEIDAGRPYKLQGVDAALRVLEVFEATDFELSIADISLRSGLHRSVVYRILRTLANRRYVEQYPKSGKYRLGLAALRLGSVSAANLGIGPRMQTVLSSTADQSGESVSCAVLDGGHALIVGRALSNHDLRPNVKIGHRRPLHCTALGKVMLADLSEARLREVLADCSLERYTSRTICDLQQLCRELKLVRLQGYAWSKDEWTEGLTCVAAPVPRSAEHHPMAVTIALPSARYSPDHAGKLQDLVIEAGQQIAQLISEFESLGEGMAWDSSRSGRDYLLSL